MTTDDDSRQQRTFVERLDAARDGDEFVSVLGDLFTWLDKVRDNADD